MDTETSSQNQDLEAKENSSNQPLFREAPRRPLKEKVARLSGFIASVLAVSGGMVAFLAYFTYAQDLPQFDSVDQYRPKLVTKVYSTDGRLIGEFGTERRTVVPYTRIPKHLIQAFIASEDKKFFDHHGIDYIGIANAVFQKVTGQRKKLRGASTITQQLAKSLLIAHEGFEKGTERSIRRKLKEAILASRLESDLNKEEIIWLYLNQVYLGHGAYGVQSAAESYFRKNVEELNLAEMSLLAGLPQAPSRFSPVNNPSSARARQEYVLRRMVTDKYISEEDRTEALAMEIEKKVQPRDNQFADTAPYFAEHVRRYIYDKYGEKTLYEGGLKIYTTLDLERQKHAEDVLVEKVREVDRRQGYLGPVAHLNSLDKREKAIALIEKKRIKGKPLEYNTSYMAVVNHVDSDNQWALINVGDVEGILPLAGLRWAREVNPNAFWENNLINRIELVLKKGDVVMVVPMTRKQLVRKAYSNAIARKMPQEPTPLEELKKGTKLPLEKRPLFALDQIPRVEAALIAMAPDTGYVEAMIGGYAYERSEFNRAFQSCRMPGSSFKPIVYSAAVGLEGYNPATLILDTPITIRDQDIGKSWKPQNFELSYKGEVTCREAVMNSMNVPALKTMEKVGIRNVVAWAKKLGIQTKLKLELGTAIGSSCVRPWELTNAYTTFARMGLRPEPVFVKRVIDRDGIILEEHASPSDAWQTREERVNSLYRKILQPAHRVMDAEDAYITHYLLTQVVKHGTAARARSLGHPAAGKTGTTNDSFDTWFVGYTKSLVASVWVGYDSMKYPLAVREQGGRTALPIWLDFMKKSLEGHKQRTWKPPSGICEFWIDSQTGSRLSDAGSGQAFKAPFRCGTEPALMALEDVDIEDAMNMGGM